MDQDLETLIVALNKVVRSESRIRNLAAGRPGRADRAQVSKVGAAPADLDSVTDPIFQHDRMVSR
jgi:hypothetical protein